MDWAAARAEEQAAQANIPFRADQEYLDKDILAEVIPALGKVIILLLREVAEVLEVLAVTAQQTREAEPADRELIYSHFGERQLQQANHHKHIHLLL
jgi:hypothetical protein